MHTGLQVRFYILPRILHCHAISFVHSSWSGLEEVRPFHEMTELCLTDKAAVDALPQVLPHSGCDAQCLQCTVLLQAVNLLSETHIHMLVLQNFNHSPSLWLQPMAINGYKHNTVVTSQEGQVSNRSWQSNRFSLIR